MSSRRFVFLDPGGMADGWLHVIVQAETGVFYQQPRPIAGVDSVDALCELFENDFRVAGTGNYSWPDDERDRLARIVADISYWASDGHTEEPHALRLDESRMREADEDGCRYSRLTVPEYWVWSNSD